MKNLNAYISLTLLSAMSVLPVTIILPSLPSIAVDVSSPYWLLNLSVTIHAFVAALAQIVGGALSDYYGRRLIGFCSLLLFVIASLGCMLSSDIYAFLTFRALQAPIIVCFSISLASVSDIAGKENASSRIGYVSAAWAIAPLVGPTFGGFLEETFGWRSIFGFLSIVGVLLLGLLVRTLPEGHQRSKRLDQNSQFSISRSVVELMRSREFIGYTSCMAFSIGTLYVFLGWTPFAMGQHSKITSSQLGVLMGLVPGGFVLGSVIAGKIGNTVSKPLAMVLGRIISFFGILVGLVMILSSHGPYLITFFCSCTFIGIGNGLSMANANAGVLELRDDIPVTASSIASALTTTGGVTLSTLFGLIINEENSYHSIHTMMLFTTAVALTSSVYIYSIINRKENAQLS